MLSLNFLKRDIQRSLVLSFRLQYVLSVLWLYFIWRLRGWKLFLTLFFCASIIHFGQLLQASEVSWMGFRLHISYFPLPNLLFSNYEKSSYSYATHKTTISSVTAFNKSVLGKQRSYIKPLKGYLTPRAAQAAAQLRTQDVHKLRENVLQIKHGPAEFQYISNAKMVSYQFVQKQICLILRDFHSTAISLGNWSDSMFFSNYF